MSARAIRRLSDERGTAAIEFAIMAPVLVMFIIGAIVVGWAMYGMATVHNALELASRALQLSPSLTEDDLIEMIAEDVSLLGDPILEVTLTRDTEADGFQLAHIAATYTFSITVPFVSEQTLQYATSVSVPLVVS